MRLWLHFVTVDAIWNVHIAIINKSLLWILCCFPFASISVCIHWWMYECVLERERKSKNHILFGSGWSIWSLAYWNRCFRYEVRKKNTHILCNNITRRLTTIGHFRTYQHIRLTLIFLFFFLWIFIETCLLCMLLKSKKKRKKKHKIHIKWRIFLFCHIQRRFLNLKKKILLVEQWLFDAHFISFVHFNC